MPTVTLTPTVVDDAWGGALTYAWTQVSGPDTATIVSPTALVTDVTFSSLGGSYVFRLTVTRATDGFTGTGLWHVYVFAGTARVLPDDELGDVVVTVNGATRSRAFFVQSVHIEDALGQTPTCTFDTDEGSIDIFNEIFIERGALRLFGGICLSLGLTVEAGKVVVYHPHLVGYAWHLSRVRVTKTYTNESITDIAADLLGLAPGGITDDFIAADLPIATVVFDDVTIADAFNRLTQVERGLHFYVDHEKRAHLAYVETDGEGVELSPIKPFLADGVSITTDGTQVANRVTVHYTQVIAKPALVDEDIRVDTLDGYSASGGDTIIDGNRIHYTGTDAHLIDPVYGAITPQLLITPVEIVGGELSDSYMYAYGCSLTTGLGETPVVTAFSGVPPGTPNNAFSLRLNGLLGDPAIAARVTGINVYRQSNEPTSGGQFATDWNFIGTLSPKGGPGFVDQSAFATLAAAPLAHPPAINTADEEGFFLTGCTGSQDVYVPSEVMVEDTAAQADLAVLLGGGSETGLIELSVDGGTISDLEAQTLAQSLLEESIDLRTEFSGRVRDDRAIPGAALALNFPAPIDRTADLKIRQTTVTGFTPRVPHDRRIVAGPDQVRLEDLLRGAASGGSSRASVGGSGGSSAGGGGMGAPGPPGPAGPAGADSTPIVGSVDLTNQSASIPYTTITGSSSWAAGWYRVTYSLRELQPAPTASSLTPKLRFVDGGVTVVKTFPAFVANVTDEIDSASALIHKDAATAVEYGADYASS